MKRYPHPARRSRIATLGLSSTAFVSIVTSLAWNTHQAELVANVTDANAMPAGATVPAATATATTPAPTVTTAATPAATIAPTAPAAPAATKAPAKSAKTSAPAPSVAPATPAAPAAPTNAAPAPAAPAPTVVYTCMSPGGKTENPTTSGKCKNAQYGYVLTQI